MASNCGTSLIVGNGKLNQLYWASNAVYQPEKHGISEIMFRNVQASSHKFQWLQPSSISNQRRIHPRRCKFAESSIDDTISPIRDESRKRHARDALLKFPKDDDFRHKVSTKVNSSCEWMTVLTIKSNVQPTTYNNRLSRTNQRPNRGWTRRLRLWALYAHSHFRGVAWGIARCAQTWGQTSNRDNSKQLKITLSVWYSNLTKSGTGNRLE